MNTQFKPHMDREAVSALMDGALPGDELSAALNGMDAHEARECWLTYQLVGDVLRSADLAAGRHDLAFAQGLRQRLMVEAQPTAAVVSAPQSATVRGAARPAANDGVFRWKMVAGLASFAAVAAIGWGMLGSVAGPASGPQLAQAPAPGGTQAVALVSAPTTAHTPATPASESTPVMLRDARLDELLAAHRAAAGMSALGNGAGFLRNATFEGPGR